MENENCKFILAGNGPYDNRGCEGIIRGTVKILNNHYKNPYFICMSHFHKKRQYLQQLKNEYDPNIIHKECSRGLIRNFLKSKKINWTFGYELMYKEMLPYLKNSEAVLSIGGDNYTLDYDLPVEFIGLDNVVLKYKKPLIIWGASIGPFSKLPKFEDYMFKHLSKVTAIFARESITINYLKEKGQLNNIYKMSDPAFLMETKKPKENISIEKNSIGINFSEVMAKYVTNGDVNLWVKKAANIILEILNKYSNTIYLIPHVSGESYDNDHIFLNKIMNEIEDKENKIILIPSNYDAKEIKWIISKMDMFAGARTHSIIAALSSGVPTISFSYSIKSKGINRDIFGHEKFCLDPFELEPTKIINVFNLVNDQKKEIRMHLQKEIPQIQDTCYKAGATLKSICARASETKWH